MTKKRYRYKHLEFWAERGLIHIVDERFPHNHEKAYSICNVTDFLHRLKALNDETSRWKKRQWIDERDKIIKLVEDGVKACKEAKAQGRPDDPRVIADMLNERRRSMLHAGTSSKAAGGAVSASIAPESSKLPPIPQVPSTKPITEM